MSEKSEKKQWSLLEIINSKIVILILGFALTGVVGRFLANHYNQIAWEREANLKIAMARYEKDEKTILEITDSISSRFELFSMLSLRVTTGDIKWVKGHLYEYNILQKRQCDAINRYMYVLKYIYNDNLVNIIECPDKISNKNNINFLMSVCDQYLMDAYMALENNENDKYDKLISELNKNLGVLYKATNSLLSKMWEVFASGEYYKKQLIK